MQIAMCHILNDFQTNHIVILLVCVENEPSNEGKSVDVHVISFQNGLGHKENTK